MTTQTINFVQVTEKAEEVILLGRRHHWRFKIIPDFHGMIDKPIVNSSGNWIYMPLREEDKVIIPKLAYKQHAIIEKAGYRIAQVVIGHEIVVAPDDHNSPTIPSQKIDLVKVAEVASKGLLAGISGIATVAFSALAGAFMLFDPSYCIVLSDGKGTVIELLTWHAEM